MVVLAYLVDGALTKRLQRRAVELIQKSQRLYLVALDSTLKSTNCYFEQIIRAKVFRTKPLTRTKTDSEAATHDAFANVLRSLMNSN